MSMLLAFLLAAAPAFARDALEAEHIRLSGDIEQLAKRQVWAGVEKKLAELQKLGLEPSFEDLVHGAYAARALGNAQDAYERLKAAAKVKGTREIVDWLFSIDANYGQVELLATPPRGVALEVADVPFEPDQRTAVQAAIELVRKDGQFFGLLPRGSYTFAGQTFSVEPGISVRIEVSPKLKKSEGELIKVTTTPVDEAPAEPTP